MRCVALAGAAVMVALLATGCGQQMRAERDGRDLAQSVCDLADVTDAQSLSAALDDIQAQTRDLADRFGSVTKEDQNRIKENLADLKRHVADGDEALIKQDLAALERNAEQIRTEAGKAGDAAWDGFTDELNTCAT